MMIGKVSTLIIIALSKRQVKTVNMPVMLRKYQLGDGFCV